MRYGYEDKENPYEPPETTPQIRQMTAQDFFLFVFFTVGLGFCFGVIFGIWFVS